MHRRGDAHHREELPVEVGEVVVADLLADGRYRSIRPFEQPTGLRDAERTDGVTWVKSELGLVEFRGSKKNNLGDVGGAWSFVNPKVIKDAVDPDASRR